MCTVGGVCTNWKVRVESSWGMYTVYAFSQDESGVMTFDVDSSVLSKAFIKEAKIKISKQTDDSSKQLKTIMDARRAQNVGIVVMRLRLPPDVSPAYTHIDTHLMQYS